MDAIDKLLADVWKAKDVLLKGAEVVLAAVMFCGAVYFGINAFVTFLHRDWSTTATVYDFITHVLVLLLAFEVVRLILVHSIAVVMELLLLVVARKMLYPDITGLDIMFYTVAFAVMVGVYYLYELKPLKSLDDLTK